MNSENILKNVAIKSRVLVIRRWALGDVIMATPIIRALHNPYTDIDVLTAYPEVFKNNPYVRHVFTPQQFSLRLEDYDRIINLEPVSMLNPKLHQVDGYGIFGLQQLLSEEQKRLELFPSAEDMEIVERYLSAFPDKFIAIHMRRKHPELGGAQNRNVSDQFWLNLLTQLNRYGIPIIQLGTDNDFYVPPQHNIFSAINQFSIQQLQCLIAKASLLICVDTSMLHIAGTTQTPIIALFTVVYPELRRPAMSSFHPILPEVDCFGCFSDLPPPAQNMDSCKFGGGEYNSCVEKFSIEKILKKVDEILTLPKRTS